MLNDSLLSSMATTVIILGISGAMLAGHVFLLVIEQKHGERVFLRRFRGWLDRILSKLMFALDDIQRWFIHYVVKITWHKTAYSVLKSSAHLIGGLYDVIEAKMHLNRNKLTHLRKKTSVTGQLSQISDHKKAVSLSDEEKERLRRTSLE